MGLLESGLELVGGYLASRYNAKEASKSRNYGRDMSNTAYQRAAADLQKAGLNRILAIGNGASTPSSATASISAPDLAGAFTQGNSARSQISLQQQQKQLMKEQTDLATEQRFLTKQQSTKAYAEAQAAMESASDRAKADIALTKANAELSANNARSAKVEADFQESLSPGEKAAYSFMKDIGFGGAPAKLLEGAARKLVPGGRK